MQSTARNPSPPPYQPHFLDPLASLSDGAIFMFEHDSDTDSDSESTKQNRRDLLEETYLKSIGPKKEPIKMDDDTVDTVENNHFEITLDAPFFFEPCNTETSALKSKPDITPENDGFDMPPTSTSTHLPTGAMPTIEVVGERPDESQAPRKKLKTLESHKDVLLSHIPNTVVKHALDIPTIIEEPRMQDTLMEPPDQLTPVNSPSPIKEGTAKRQYRKRTEKITQPSPQAPLLDIINEAAPEIVSITSPTIFEKLDDTARSGKRKRGPTRENDDVPLALTPTPIIEFVIEQPEKPQAPPRKRAKRVVEYCRRVFLKPHPVSGTDTVAQIANAVPKQEFNIPNAIEASRTQVKMEPVIELELRNSLFPVKKETPKRRYRTKEMKTSPIPSVETLGVTSKDAPEMVPVTATTSTVDVIIKAPVVPRRAPTDPIIKEPMAQNGAEYVATSTYPDLEAIMQHPLPVLSSSKPLSIIPDDILEGRRTETSRKELEEMVDASPKISHNQRVCIFRHCRAIITAVGRGRIRSHYTTKNLHKINPGDPVCCEHPLCTYTSYNASDVKRHAKTRRCPVIELVAITSQDND